MPVGMAIKTAVFHLMETAKLYTSEYDFFSCEIFKTTFYLVTKYLLISVTSSKRDKGIGQLPIINTISFICKV